MAKMNPQLHAAKVMPKKWKRKTKSSLILPKAHGSALALTHAHAGLYHIDNVVAQFLAFADDVHIHRSYGIGVLDRKSTRLNSSHANISYAVFCLKKKC